MASKLQKFIPSASKALLVMGLIFGLSAFILLGLAFAEKKYADKVYPGVYLGDESVSEMDRGELKDFIQKMLDKIVAEGVDFTLILEDDTKEFVLHPIITGSGEAKELFHIDVEREVEHILSAGKNKPILARLWQFSMHKMGKRSLSLKLDSFELDKELFEEILMKDTAEFETLPQDADFVISSFSPLKYDFSSSTIGYTFDYEGILSAVEEDWQLLRASKEELRVHRTDPDISSEELAEILPGLENIFDAGSLVFTYTEEGTERKSTWKMNKSIFGPILDVSQDENQELSFILDKKYVEDWLKDTIAVDIEREPRNAKFQINEGTGRVEEFKTSKSGILLSVTSTYEGILLNLEERMGLEEGDSEEIDVVVEEKAPDVSTSDVNDLGITEILGIGISDFSGSPRNRVLNIKNGANLLDGLLIAPGEEFSSIEHTRPYTTANGYLPELVIKGDEIKPEIGGGLCQVGTTLFRMAMNSGLEITQRRNHTLSVSYYADPVNRLPGTDATIYEPAPDFRFKNDTENYILIDTEVDYNSSELIFRLWGTSDGRKGSYTHPVVHQWYYPGESITKVSEDLAPGEKNCQHAYTGADASFTYSRVMPNGETIDRVFESHYRPLPQICLVGPEESSPVDDNDGFVPPVSSVVD